MHDAPSYPEYKTPEELRLWWNIPVESTQVESSEVTSRTTTRYICKNNITRSEQLTLYAQKMSKDVTATTKLITAQGK